MSESYWTSLRTSSKVAMTTLKHLIRDHSDIPHNKLYNTFQSLSPEGSKNFHIIFDYIILIKFRNFREKSLKNTIDFTEFYKIFVKF